MNYRHAYHAGNHADVLKHVVLARVIEHLKIKDKPFRVIDAHAGIGIYDLAGLEAGKTGEWEGGIGRMGAVFPPHVEELLKPYRRVLAELNGDGPVIRYPGSPWLAAALMRLQDRLIANELHPADRTLLADCFRPDGRVMVQGLDAAACVKASLPPPERRGLILIDPPYEVKDEAERAIQMLADGVRRFATGCFLLWYPVKADGLEGQISDAAAAMEIPGTLRIELRVRESFKGGGLAGSGLIIINPPWRIDEELGVLVPALAGRLGKGDWGQGTISWLLPPR
ncbi:23S rRNA (adenine(2030)-N(6))-methyltransferase RlmJ [Aestuariivirga sp.]|uniref:23S rRNA (adenine(2030)-N(6))-methyltransferase RlmJ n=1 Tax=Aestuariivirga sp. TaxID=2650926 RepID=UPI0039E6C081